MRADNTRHLARAARLRSEQTRQRVTEAIRRLDHDGHDITIVAISREAGVSRSYIYRHDDLRTEIERLRQHRPTARPLPSRLRATEESQRARAEALRAEIERLTEENRWLRQQAEALLGERRASPRQP
jgi:AraC-like DNA-binding protein